MNMNGLRSLLVCLVVLSFTSPSVLALLEEDTEFEERHDGVDFPVGWTEFRLDGTFSPQVRMVYPAMFAGENKDMAGNGPFSWLVFIGDSGESIDSYTLFTDELAKRGYIVVVTQPVSDETDVEETLGLLTDIDEVMTQQNQTNLHVMGSASNIDVEHWGVSGHGKGAAAAYLAYPFWNLSERSSTAQPPRGLFGLGLDLEDLDEDFAWEDVAPPLFPRPNSALFITGTVDEVAPSQETMDRVEAHAGVAWQWMHLLGANHYQFQDSQSFFESDGDATMSQTAQIDLSAQHVIAYLDTILHGDHERFREAFNRAEGPRTVSDSNAYVSEDLSRASFLRWTSESVSHNASETVNATQTLRIELNWTLRDGTPFSGLPPGWDVNVTCGWYNGPWEVHPSLSANGSAVCDYPMSPVAPGLQKAWLKVEVEGAPSVFTTTVFRENTPIEPVSPKPVIYLPQHGSTSINASAIAVDPDGQDVRFVNATLSCVDSEHFGVALSEDDHALEVVHAINEEWLGECQVNLVLRSAGQTVDELTTQLRIVLTPVDDPPVKEGIVPIQEMDEDAASVVYNILDVVSDPEGEELDARVAGQKTGEQSPIRYSIQGEYITLTPLPNQNGATVLQVLVSDGVNPSLMLEVPIVVNAMDDPVIINASAWTNLSMDEDTSLTLDLGPLAYDVDGDVLSWTLEGLGSDVAVSRINNSMQITPTKDYFGTKEGGWLNVSDGTTTYSHSFSLTVEPVGDLPFVNIESVQSLGGTTANMYWSVLDVDGVVNTEANVSVDNVPVVVNHSCLSSSSGMYQCVTMLPVSETSSTSFYIQLEIYDAELGRSIIATMVFDPTANASNATGSEDEVQGDDEGLSTFILVGTGVGLLFLVAGVVLMLRGRDEGAMVVPSTSSKEPEPAEQTGGTGLLARAERLK